MINGNAPDVHMPGMTGLELQEHLAAQGCCVPIIFVTAYDTPQTREHAGKAGSFGLLLKPFRHEELLGAIRAAVGSRTHPTAFEQVENGAAPAGA
jgi:FixJ family two-component response regulator